MYVATNKIGLTIPAGFAYGFVTPKHHVRMEGASCTLRWSCAGSRLSLAGSLELGSVLVPQYQGKVR
jgi:hypothetical protein